MTFTERLFDFPEVGALPAEAALLPVIWSPSQGDIAFTGPLFDFFMHRIMPGGRE